MTRRNRFDIGVASTTFDIDTDDAQIVFHGINKSGSLVLSNVIKEAYEFEGRDEEFVSHYHRGGDFEAFRQHLISDAPCPSFVVAHYLFGALPPYRRRIWVTQFRHPLPRIVSCYSWLQKKHETQTGTAYISLPEFVDRSRGVTHSQVMQLGAGWGAGRTRLMDRLAPSDLYEIAIDRLESCVSLIGIAERFEESIFSFARICRLRSVLPWERDERNSDRPLVDELEPDHADLIREVFAYDFKLYSHALSRFEEQVADLGIGPHDVRPYELACEAQYKDRIVERTRSND